MKGQVAIMEYVVLLIMIVFIILFLLLMVFGFELMGSETGRSEDLDRRSLFTLQRMTSSEIINSPSFQKGSVFDDAKLTALNSLGCDDFRGLYGQETWAKVERIFEKETCHPIYNPDCNDYIESIENVECTPSIYPHCGYWEFCDENKGPRMMYRTVPVNVYIKMNETTVLGALSIGVRLSE